MALIKKSKTTIENVSGGYHRVFGNEQLGLLMSKVQSAVIRSGKELEDMVRERTTQIEDLDKFLKQKKMNNSVSVAHKSAVKNSRSLNFDGSEPDFVVFKQQDGEQHCYVIELKDGHNFDTKKAAGEHKSMTDFVRGNAQNLPCTASIHFCCFNQISRDKIVEGFKRKITLEEAMTGREFCELLELDYDAIVEERKGSSDPNLPFFLSELVKIDVVKDWLDKHFR